MVANLGNEEGAYKEIWGINDDKWQYQLHRHLHAAAYYLNPRFQYSDGLSSHIKVKIGLMVCKEKLIPDEEVRVRANLQVNLFKNKEGFFSHERAKDLVENLSPNMSTDWWSEYGDKAPELKDFAVKILSLICSSSACERNWSTINLIHTKNRNRLSIKKLNSLVYIMYNKRLQHRYLKKKALRDDEDPLVHKGKALQRVDKERMWDDISNQYNSPGTSDDDDDEGGYSFDPHFKPFDTNDSLWDD
ncbi:hypothetical protein Ddye_021618 [Dipteronia dyeriana]|uniref:HAT C-terminal dimerisation domain-containing protein n=1 Tax=Dipteronia dyeriana TaxID=168575 RepID=A0AAD9U2H1_9ROSI|nr:hypothetical protein Ddye_021618 [Dipteronia dyeriana]